MSHEMLSRAPVPRDRRRVSSGTAEAAAVSVAGHPLLLSGLLPSDDSLDAETQRQRLAEYRRHVKLVPVRRELLYYEGARQPDRRTRKMRRSRSMRDGELVAANSKASCLGFLELRAPPSRRRPHSVEAAERVSLVPVLTATPSASMDLQPAESGPEEAQVRIRSVPTVLVPVDVSGEAFERYCALRRSLRGVEYQRVAVTRRSAHAERRKPRHHSYDALAPQLAALQDPSRATAAFPEDPRRRHRHSMAPSAPAPPPPASSQRLATVRRSSSMPATPPASSTGELGSWRHSSDLASTSSSTASRRRLTLGQRARQLFRARSRSAENCLDDGAPARARSKSPFRWLGSRRSRERSRKARSTVEEVRAAAPAAVEGEEEGKENGRAKEEVFRPASPRQLASARPPTAVDCPDYRESLAALTKVLVQRDRVIPAAFTGSEPLQGIPLHKVKVWLRSGRDVIRNRRAHDRYSADARPLSVPISDIDLSQPIARSKSFFSRSGPSQASERAANDRRRCSAQEAGQRAKLAFAGQCVTRVSLSQSTSEHLDKLSHQFNRAVTLRRSYRHRKGDDRRSSSGNWSASSSSTRPSRSSSTGAAVRIPRSLSKDSALGMHCSSVDRSDPVFATGAASFSSLSSLSTRGTPEVGPARLHYTVLRLDNGHSPEPIYALPNKPKLLSSVAESPSRLLRHSEESPPVKRRPPPPPPRVDSLRTVGRGLLTSPDSWYSDLLPYKCNTLPRNLHARLRQRDSLPTGGGLADMFNSWPRPGLDDGPPTPTAVSSSSSSTTAVGAPPAKALNFAPTAALNVYDTDVPTNHCAANAMHRVLKPEALPAPNEEPQHASPQLRQYRRLYSLGSSPTTEGDSEYEDEATMV